MTDDLGLQGGDPAAIAGGVLDLSTCVNAYGPAPAALERLRDLPSSTLLAHPYDAADAVRRTYAAHLGVESSELVVGRGTTEFVWRLAETEDRSRFHVVRPAYTDFIRAFPGCEVGSSDLRFDIEAIEPWLADHAQVLISNPLNPTGEAISGSALAELCRAYPGSRLIVDESYVEFTPDPAEVTLIGRDVVNALVLQSPSKFYGIAGARTGVAWSRDVELRDRLTASRGPWPLSGIDAELTIAALTDQRWAQDVRERLISDGHRLEKMLSGWSSTVRPGSRTHFRLWAPAAADRLAEVLQNAGVRVRVLASGHGFASPVLRVAAPTRHDVSRFEQALASVQSLSQERGSQEP